MDKRTRRSFTPEFKAETVALARRSGKSTRQIARELGLAETTLQRWVARAEIDAGHRDGLSTAEREELSQLRRELRTVREERDGLAKVPMPRGGAAPRMEMGERPAPHWRRSWRSTGRANRVVP